MSDSHDHRVQNSFTLGIFLNVTFIFVELYFGFASRSVALIADATHNAGDVLGLFVAWFGFALAKKKAPSRFTFGFKNATILAAFLNALFLFGAGGHHCLGVRSSFGTRSSTCFPNHYLGCSSWRID